MEFYDAIADQYDEMTNLFQRQDQIEEFLQKITAKWQIHSALDVACGTGFYTIKLAQMGMEAVGTDYSSGMIEKAKKLARQMGADPRWLEAPMQDIAGRLDRTFDLILCLGNSIVHLLDPAELKTTIRGFAQLMRPAGVLLIHLLNYPRIVREKERIVAISRSGNTQFIRFYDFLPDSIQFNLLKIDWDGQNCRHELVSTPLFPYAPDDIVKVLDEFKFTKINLFADYKFRAFDREKSQSVLIEAHWAKS